MNIDFNLSSKSVQNAKAYIQQYQRQYRRKMTKVMEQTAKDTEKYAKKRLLKYNAFDSGETYNSIYVLISDDRSFKLHFGGASGYVEFGTGIVGKLSPHPLQSELGIVYDVNQHGLKGWTYYDERRKKWNRTTGMESRPFIYDSKKYMVKRFRQLLKKEMGGKNG